jgi:hypothetical protein
VVGGGVAPRGVCAIMRMVSPGSVLGNLCKHSIKKAARF